MATCKRCGEFFYREPGEKWKRFCLECWIDLQNDKKRIENLEAENEHLRRQNEQLISRLFAPAPGEPSDQLTEWLSRHLKFLIFATHPDRNGGTKQAGEVCRYLLDLRAKRKTRAGNAGSQKN